MKKNLEDIINIFLNYGYEISFRDKNRYIELKKVFNNSDAKVDGAEEVQIARFIEIWDNNIISKAYMKRGWLWSGSAYVQKNKGNSYSIGAERLIARI